MTPGTPMPPPPSTNPRDARDGQAGDAMTARELALALDPEAEHCDGRWWPSCPLPHCAEPSRRVQVWDTVADKANTFAGCSDVVVVATCGCQTIALRAYAGGRP